MKEFDMANIKTSRIYDRGNDSVREYVRVFRAFSDENRVRVIELLSAGEQCACVLLDDLKISQPTLSHHMKILAESGIVKQRRQGKWSYYSINGEGCRHAKRLIDAVMKHKLPYQFRALHLIRRLIYTATGRDSCIGQVLRTNASR
jgi:ArsR family transcriptional regulator